MQTQLIEWLCASILCSLPSFAAQENSYQAWLEFKSELAVDAGGATGYYAIQDMHELKPGDTAYLASSDDMESIRWSDKMVCNPLARVEYRNHTALISGLGIPNRLLLQLKNQQITLANGLIVRASFLHGTELKVWLYNPALPAKRQFEELAFFDFEPTGVVQGVFERYEVPAAVTYLDSRDEEGTMYVMGALRVNIHGQSYDLKAYSYSKSWKDIDGLLFLLRDRTSGQSSYAGGRVVGANIPKGAPPASLSIDLNTAYSFLCAHSNFYNCPLVLTNYIDAQLNYGEKYPPIFSRDDPPNHRDESR